MVPPPVPPCAGKESLMACHSSGRIVTVPVYVSWDAEMFPPLTLASSCVDQCCDSGLIDFYTLMKPCEPWGVMPHRH